MRQPVALSAALLASRVAEGEAVDSAVNIVTAASIVTAKHVPCIQQSARVVETRLQFRFSREMIAPFIAATATAPSPGAPSIAAAIAADRAGKRNVPNNRKYEHSLRGFAQTV